MTRKATTIIPFTELIVAGPYDAATKQGNYDTTRIAIDRVIIHTMVGSAESAAARFADPNSNVSAHYGVKLDGSLVHWLEEYYTAYHAGDYAMNQRSIGIEHEDNGDYNGLRTDALYETSAKLVADVCKFYAIPCDRSHIFKHSEVSDRPTGCPDALDIDRIVLMAQQLMQTGTYVDEATFTMLVDKANQRDEFVKIGYTNADAVTQKVTSLQQEITSLQTSVGDLTNKNQALALSLQQEKDVVASLTDQMQKMATSDSTAIDTGLQAQHDLKNLKYDIHVIAEASKSQSDSATDILSKIAEYQDLITKLQTQNPPPITQPKKPSFWEQLFNKLFPPNKEVK